MSRPVHVYVTRRVEDETARELATLRSDLLFWQVRAEVYRDQLEAIADAAKRGDSILIDAVGVPIIELVVKPKDAES